MNPTLHDGEAPPTLVIPLLSTFSSPFLLSFFFFNDTATTEIYTLSLHDALPIWFTVRHLRRWRFSFPGRQRWRRSEEHTSELQSHSDLVCRLLLGKLNRHDPSSHISSTHAPAASCCEHRPPVYRVANAAGEIAVS